MADTHEIIQVPDDAVAAFAATFDGNSPSDEPVAPVTEEVVEQAAPEVEVTPTVEVGTTEAPAEDSFRGFDETLLDALPPELKAAVTAERKSIQGEATRKFQEAADLRKQFEGIDPELARNAVTYMERLSDPEFLVEAAAAMQEELERQGLTPAQAAQVTADAIEEQTSDDDDYELDGSVDPRIQSELQELKDYVASQVAKEAERDERDRLSYLANEALKAETAIRKDNPEWDDQDIADVIGMTWQHKGDMFKAAESYRKQEARLAKRLLSNKSSISSQIAPPPSGGTAQEAPVGFGTNLDAAHKAAMERLRNILAGE